MDGLLDTRATDLLTEVARAALIAVKRASRIHLDLTAAHVTRHDPPRVVRRLEQAGASVAWAQESDVRDLQSAMGPVP